jgi:hypothetical protein
MFTLPEDGVESLNHVEVLIKYFTNPGLYGTVLTLLLNITTLPEMQSYIGCLFFLLD